MFMNDMIESRNKEIEMKGIDAMYDYFVGHINSLMNYLFHIVGHWKHS